MFGGSLGARRLNDAAIDAFGAAAPCAVLHAAGRRDYDTLLARLVSLGSPPHYRLFPYVEPFADALAAADLAAARAGGSVFELAAAGLASILVPYPHATGNHQDANARFMEQAGAAIVIPDDELDGPRLAREVGGLLGAPQRMAAMSNAAREVARPDAAEVVAREVLRVVTNDGIEGWLRRGEGPRYRRLREQPLPGRSRTIVARAMAGDSLNAPFAGRALHFIGIGGAGMSGLALVAQQLGAAVTGSDQAESSYCERLRAAGIEPVIGHDASNVPEGAEVVVSTAIPEDNPELARPASPARPCCIAATSSVSCRG